MVLMALPAAALGATISGYLGNTNLFPNGRFYSGNPCNASAGFDTSGTFYYQFRQIQVSATGSYAYSDYGVQVNNDGIIDGYVGIYTGSPTTFDPTSAYGNGCVAIFDDSGSVNLNAGVTYTLVITSFEGSLDPGDGDNNVGNYQFSLTGPGAVSLVVAKTAPTPTLNDWGLLILISLLALAAVRGLYRKQT